MVNWHMAPYEMNIYHRSRCMQERVVTQTFIIGTPFLFFHSIWSSWIANIVADFYIACKELWWYSLHPFIPHNCLFKLFFLSIWSSLMANVIADFSIQCKELWRCSLHPSIPRSWLFKLFSFSYNLLEWRPK